MLVRSLLEWFSAHARDLPWRRTRDPYAIWISEIMLQQTQVRSVIPYWERWMRELPTIQALAAAPTDRVLKLWEGLGYYTRARNLHRAARIIRDDHGGAFPETFDAVLALPGIGRYTAGAVCSIAFNQPTPILDGNVIRVLTRLFAIGGNVRAKETNAELWKLAETLVRRARTPEHADRNGCSHLNQSLMELGATVCTPREPLCAQCPVARLCTARQRNRVEDFPALPPRPESVAREFSAFVVSFEDRVLVRRRPSGGVNARLWEFPNMETTGATPDASAAARQCVGPLAAAPKPLCVIKHAITRSRITLRVFAITASRREARRFPAAHWRSPSELDQLTLPSAHRRIAQKWKQPL
jgi:A/G-specific adenine glycosylase